ncbi:MAG TPA: KTSC domain-containing protein [Pseudolabrys sp.]|nr:KTSC domain-containing protein [Pseudolabrys sp.]
MTVLHDGDASPLRTEDKLARCRDMPSTAIADIKYDAGRERLTVIFVTGCTYEYVDVPAEVAASFQSSFSKGAFFDSYIRDRYDFREMHRRAS